ncbi:MAG: hypothetical protein COB66_08420 [Coxiella sp. (in: Bacteria)]|nr:MAG: hypothetical protein COB66_08420 [Coxiella sp. (in: g-proteobacteria)]
MLKTIGIAAGVILAINVSAFAATASLASKYNCNGHDPMSKKSYKRILRLTPMVYVKNEYYTTGNYPHEKWAASKGLGFVYNTKKNKLFATMFKDPSYGKGMILYTIQDGKLVDGEFIYYYHPNAGRGTETCTPATS